MEEGARTTGSVPKDVFARLFYSPHTLGPPRSFPSCAGWACVACTLHNDGADAWCASCGSYWDHAARYRSVWLCDCGAVCAEPPGEAEELVRIAGSSPYGLRIIAHPLK